MSHFVHVDHASSGAWQHDTAAAIHHGSYSGISHHDGVMKRSYSFPTEHDAKAFHEKLRLGGHKAHLGESELEDEAGSFDPYLATVIAESAKFPSEYYQAFMDLDEACAFAEEASRTNVEFLAFGVVFSALYEEFRVGPISDNHLWALGDAEMLKYYESGKHVDEMVKRHSVASVLSRKRALHTTMDSKRRKVAQTAKMWRLGHKSKLAGRKSLYDRPNSPLESAIVDLQAGKPISEVVTELLK
jgi:hypothetical protein